MEAISLEINKCMTYEAYEELKKSLDFIASKDSLNSVINKTELIESPFFSSEYGNQVFIKPENLQNTGSFKIRGAYNKIAKLTKDERNRGLIASSAGNHAQGVAFAAQALGANATIVMPKTTPLIKVEATKNFGAQVILEGNNYDEAYAEAKRLQSIHDYTFIHPFDNIDVIEGQGTIGLEIMEELSDADIILVPVGGGGLIAGVAYAAKQINPNIKIIGVEPIGANAMEISIDNDELTCIETVSTIADGVAVKQPGSLTFSFIREYVDEIITVSDFEIMESFLILLERHKLVGENAGVLSLAALKKLEPENKKVVCVVSGGNIDVLTVSTMINRGLVTRGRIFSFSLDLPDKPGELLKVSEILTRLNGNVIKLDHNQFKTFDRLMDVQLQITIETNGHDHIKQIVEEFENEGYNIVKIY